MKTKVIMILFCICMLGSTMACSGDEQATTAESEAANAKPEAAKAPATPQKPAANNMKKQAAPKAAQPMEEKGSAGTQMTMKECFPTAMPDSPSNNVMMCVVLAQQHPDSPFSKSDFNSLPEDCKAIVAPKCRPDE